MNKNISKFFVLGFAVIVSLAVLAASTNVRADGNCGTITEYSEKPAEAAPVPQPSPVPSSGTSTSSGG